MTVQVFAGTAHKTDRKVIAQIQDRKVNGDGVLDWVDEGEPIDLTDRRVDLNMYIHSTRRIVIEEVG